MAESLAMTRDELRGELGFRAGWGRAEDDWDEYQTDAIDSAVRSGLRRFLLNTVLPGTRKNYRWSFLRQTYTFTTAEDVDHYALPDDFGHVDGPLMHNDTTVTYPVIPVVNEAMLEQTKARAPSLTGRPQLAAVRSKRVSGVTEQREELLLYPPPDSAYPMKLGYQIEPEMLDSNVVHLPGGAAMSRAILFCCLAEMGHLLEDSASVESVYQDALAAAISYDTRQDGGFLGINGDPSSPEHTPRYLNPRAYTVTIDGLEEAAS